MTCITVRFLTLATMATVAIATVAMGLGIVPAAATQMPKDERLIAGFERIVFGAEIPGIFGGGAYLKRFAGTVRFHVENRADKNRERAVHAFLASLDAQIRGLDSARAKSADDANFIVHVVDRRDYQRIGRDIHRNPFMEVPGNCIVRSQFSRRGIERSDALIVSDEGEDLFARCLIEEVLQGLGPLNDDSDASGSVFNDASLLTRFTRYDKIMLNALYDDRLLPGMTVEEARPLLPDVIEAARRRVR